MKYLMSKPNIRYLTSLKLRTTSSTQLTASSDLRAARCSETLGCSWLPSRWGETTSEWRVAK